MGIENFNSMLDKRSKEHGDHITKLRINVDALAEKK